jgi:hypothetical protein
MPTHLFNAYFEAEDGSTLAGPVTVDKGEYLFVNKNSAADVYFNLNRSAGGWKFSGGPTSHTVPESYIKAVGAQIDAFDEDKK